MNAAYRAFVKMEIVIISMDLSNVFATLATFGQQIKALASIETNVNDHRPFATTELALIRWVLIIVDVTLASKLDRMEIASVGRK